MVRYIDYDSDTFPLEEILNACMHKRRSFEHEREFRVVVSRSEILNLTSDDCRLYTLTGEGVMLDVDLPQLIHQVYVSPACQAWFRGTVEAVIKATGYDFPVQQSALASPALF